jgi:hypothetical protein
MLEDYDTAVSKVESQLKRVSERRSKEAEKEAMAAEKWQDKKVGKKGQQMKGGGKQTWQHKSRGQQQMEVIEHAAMGVKRKVRPLNQNNHEFCVNFSFE